MKGAKMEKKGPKAKWSAKSYEITKMSKAQMYTLKGLNKRRFNRILLQPIPEQLDL